MIMILRKRKTTLSFFMVMLMISSNLLTVNPQEASADSPPASAYTIVGASVEFNGDGKFVDSLDNGDHVFAQSGITQAGGSISGPGGEVIYNAGDSEFKSITIDTTFNKWGLSYTPDAGLTVTEAVYNDETGEFTDIGQVTMVRELEPDLMANKDTVKASYVSGPIAPGTQYLRVKMPRESYFADPIVPGDFLVDAITLKSAAAAFDPVDYTVDDMSGFTHFMSGTDTSNLNVTDLSDIGAIWDARTYASLSYTSRNDATIADSAMTYEAPDGKEFKTAYVEGYYNFVPSSYFEVWTSTDGTSFANATSGGNYINGSYPYDSNWLPTALRIAALPAGTKYVQIRLPAYTSGELYGMKHPNMTLAAFGYADPGSDPVDPGDSDVTYPAETAIHFTPDPVNIDGIVETDGSGDPAGQWAGASSENIAGIVDVNDDEHSANIYLQYDYDNLYVGAKIKDPTPMKNSNTGTNIWNGDNLELFMGTDDLDYTIYPDDKLSMIPSDVQIVLSGGIDDGPQFYLYTNGGTTFPGNIAMNVHQDEDGKGYTIEASVPLSLLGIDNPWDNKKIIMNPVLNDGDSPGRGQWGWTTIGEPTKKSRSLWGMAALEPAGPPPVEISAAATVNGDTNLVTVSGQTADIQSRDVTVLVNDANGNIAYIGQAPSDEQGNYSFVFPINGDVFGSGQYTVTVGGDGVARTNSASFAFTPDTTSPAEAANVSAAGADGKLVVTWTDPADTDYDHALVSVSGQSAAPVTVAKGEQRFELGGLNNGMTYTVMIQTVDASGNVSPGTEAQGTPVHSEAADTTAPAEATGVGIAGADGKLIVTWTDPADADYDHALVSVSGQSSAPVTVAKGEQRVELGGLSNGTTYTVILQTVDAAGNISQGTEAQGTPAKPELPEQPDSDPPASNGSGNITVGPSPEKGVVQVNLNDMKPDEDGNLVVELSQEDKYVQIPVDQLALAGSSALLVKSGDAVISLPPGLLAEAAKLGGEFGAYVTVRVEKETNDSLAEAAAQENADNLKITPSGEAVSIGISLTDKDGKSTDLTVFSEPVGIRIPFDESKADKELLGVYRYDEKTGKLEYAGGRADDGAMVAAVLTPGVYQVLEYKKSFPDVPAGHWANRAIEVLSAKHIVNGVDDNRFDPDREISRADFAVLLAKALDLKTDKPSGFQDVDPTQYYADAVSALFHAGLVHGRADNEYAPAANMTREEMISLIVRACEYKTGVRLSGLGEKFADSSDISAWALDDVTAARNAGLANGKGSNKFDPKSDSARSETAQIIYNFLKIIARS